VNGLGAVGTLRLATFITSTIKRIKNKRMPNGIQEVQTASSYQRTAHLKTLLYFVRIITGFCIALT
jgi:hypothetical protein